MPNDTPDPTTEVVPTSDDEDRFYLSQSSQNAASSSSYAAEPAHKETEDDDGDDDDDEETILPVRYVPARRQESQQSHTVERQSPHQQAARAASDHPEPSTPPVLSISKAHPPDTTNAEEQAEESAMPRTPPALSAPILDPTTPPTGLETASIGISVNSVTTAASERHAVERNGYPLIDNDEHITVDSRADITLRQGDESPPRSQRSDATLPLLSSPGLSHQPTPSLISMFFVDPGPSSGRASPTQEASLPSVDHGQSQPLRQPSQVDSGSHVQADAARQGSTAITGQSADVIPLEPSTPPLTPLRMPTRNPAPRSPPIPQQPSSPPRQSTTASTVLDDEQIARAAAAQPPTPPRRQLRSRNAAQLNPYTLEAMRYQRALIRNDWEDAVVSQREWHRQERRRIAEEAARAQREGGGAQGSEQETQSQWLVPSSGPSSQADHDEGSLPPSPTALTAPQVIVDIPALSNSDAMRGHARSSRPTPSQTETLPELAEMLARTGTKQGRINRNKPGSSAAATYKGPRSIAGQGSAVPSTQSRSSERDSQVNDQDSIPLPPPARPRHPLRALSPSDTEQPAANLSYSPPNGDAFIVESSEDERPPPVASAPRAKRRSRWSGDGSSSDSTDYERRFRQLKKMMPAGMARKHIRDLRAMRHGKAYHSDGHESSSSFDAGRNANSSSARDKAKASAPRADTVHVVSDEDLQPGETRKRLRRHDSLDGHNALLLDPESDSSSSSSTSSSVSSHTSVSFMYSNNVDMDPKADGRGRSEEAEEADEAPAAWWSVNRLDSYVPYRERDAIDRMLSRTGGRKPNSKSAARRSTGISGPRQARLDGFVSTYQHRSHQAGSARSHLREIDQNQRRHQHTTVDVSEKDVQPRLPKRKKKRRKLDLRGGRTTSSRTKYAPIELRNPPVVRPRVKPRLDLERHDILFAADPIRILDPGRAEVEQGRDDADLSDDDDQWQNLGRIVLDSTPAALPDTRLAMPRSRPTAPPPQALSLASTHDAIGTPARNIHASPSVATTSGGLARPHAIVDRSPGTPTHRIQVRPYAAHVESSTAHPNVPADAAGSDAWDDFKGISLDFGMAPLADNKNLNVAGSPLLARLQDLIALPDRLLRRETVPRTWSGDVLRLDDTVLTTDMDHDALSSKLPFYMDDLRLQIGRALEESETGVDARRHARNVVADTGTFLGCWLIRQADGITEGLADVATVFRSYRMILERIEQLQSTVLNLHDSRQISKASREDRVLTCLQVTWIRFELCWRAIAICDADANYALEPDAPTVDSLLAFSRALMSLLLHDGLPHSIRNLRKAATTRSFISAPPAEAMDVDVDAGPGTSIDNPTSMWLGVVHLLDSFEKSRGIMDGRLFWTQFELAYHRWDESMPKRAPLLRSESLWYCLFAIPTLSQVSPLGQTKPAPLLRECWPLVARALSFVQFRSDEKNEVAMGWHRLAKRDAYARIVLQRCCLLVSEWRWSMDGAETTLARLFDIFNSHKLADLPTETEHDFPAFLRDFDIGKLGVANSIDSDAIQDPSFHLFVRLLARAGHELRSSVADAKEGDRRISRLFSRMTPVRVMPFTRDDVPTSSQRSVLFNHYSVVMLFLHLVPTSSPQRLRQIQSFLPAFKDADFLSQVTCIRAMMYVAVIFRHHQLDLSPVTRWFGDTITLLRREYEDLKSTTNQYERRQMQQSLQQRGGAIRPDSVRMAGIFENAPARQAALRRKEEVARLLIVALRSIQHVIRHADLNGGRREGEELERLPDQLLLHPAWTQQMLEAQIALEPRIGQEVLKCIQTFLLARIKVLNPTARAVSSARAVDGAAEKQQSRNEESQDSFAELFEADDDFDFEDPMLARLLDGAEPNAAATDGDATVATALLASSENKHWDRLFADLIRSSISPSLFQLLSNIYHPDRRLEAHATGSPIMTLGVTERLTSLPLHSSTTHPDPRRRMDALLKSAEARQYLELVVDCWAGCAHVLVSNGLREWSSYLGFGNESWKRIDDPIGRRDVGLRFLQNVLTLDPGAVRKKEYEVEFLAVWIQTSIARVLSVHDVYMTSLVAAAAPGSLLASLVERWKEVLPEEMDLDSFTSNRRALLKATFGWLKSALEEGKAGTGTAYGLLSALLGGMKAYLEDSSGDKEYAEFCKDVLMDSGKAMEASGVLGSLSGELKGLRGMVEVRLGVGQHT